MVLPRGPLRRQESSDSLTANPATSCICRRLVVGVHLSPCGRLVLHNHGVDVAIAVAPEQLMELVGSELGVSEWMVIDQERANAFADATLDHQYIHVDPERAAQTPFGGTIAHGFLTLSLLPHFLETASVVLTGSVMAINYGSDKVRFLQPVPVGSRVRARSVLAAAEERRPGQWLLKQTVTVEIDGGEKPALVADMLMLYFVQ